MATTDRTDADHLADVDDGCGCAEVWEHLSERRADATGRQGDSTERPADD